MSETMTFDAAKKQYRNEAGATFERPDKAKSTRKGEAWLLIDKGGALVAIVQDAGAVLHGSALNAWSRQLQLGMAASRK